MTTRPTPPANMPESQHESWRHVVATYPTAPPEAQEQLAVLLTRVRDASRRVDEEGAIVADERGNPAPHPALQIEERAQAQIRAWLKQFELHRKRN